MDQQLAERALDVFKQSITQADYLASVPAWRTASLEGITGRILTPTLILHSRDFRLRSMEAPLELARVLPNAQLEIIESNQLFGEPGQALDAISRFLGGLKEDTGDASLRTGPGPIESLTSRELEVLRLIAQGETNREIAEKLTISIRTVERHITHIYGKIGARGKADATAFALERQLTSAAGMRVNGRQ
jgi:DNA-binding CsgD family transcriptional regulator